jgi:hypothetical protein
VLRRRIRTEKRQRAPAGDRADVDDAPLRTAQLRQEGLRDRELADQVHLELPAELVERQELERHRDGDAGVVDETVNGVVAEPLRRRRDRGRVGDVEHDRLQPLLAQALAVGGRSHPGEHAPTGAD